MDDQTDAVLDGTPRFDEPSAAALRECPFCGEPPHQKEVFGWFLIRCVNEECLLNPECEDVTADMVIAAWNTQLGTAARVAEAVAAARAEERARLIAVSRKKYEEHHALAVECLEEKNYNMAHSHRTLATSYAKVQDWLEQGGEP